MPELPVYRHPAPEHHPINRLPIDRMMLSTINESPSYPIELINSIGKGSKTLISPDTRSRKADVLRRPGAF